MNYLKSGAQLGGEGAEEVISGFVDPALQSIYNGKTLGENYRNLNLNDLLHGGAVGMLLGGLGGSVDVAQTMRGNPRNGILSSRYDTTDGILMSGLGSADSRTKGTQKGADYRTERPQNIEMPYVPLIELSMDDLALEYGGKLPIKGNYGRNDAVARARERLGLNENEAAYIPASNVTRNGDEYILKITKSTLNKMLSPADGGDVPVESLLVMDNLERIANNGVYYSSLGDRKGRDQILGFDHLMTTVYIDGVPMVVDMRVRVTERGLQKGSDNILYYLTPEEIRIIKESGSTSAAERHALRGEVSPLSVDRIAQKQGEIKGFSTPYSDAYYADRYQELERKFLDGSISPEEADELWELERIRGSFNVSNKLYLAVDF